MRVRVARQRVAALIDYNLKLVSLFEVARYTKDSECFQAAKSQNPLFESMHNQPYSQ